MSTQTILPVDQDAVARLSQQNQEPEWLAALRAEALELAGSLELPKLEKTRIDRWNLDHYGSYKQAAVAATIQDLPQAAQALLQTEGEQAEGGVIVQQGSSITFQRLSDELAKQGVIFTDLQTAAREHGELVRKHLFSVVRKDENRLTALHAALWNGGVFLYVPKNVEVSVPLQALFIAEAGATFAPHVLVVADTNSSVTYVDNYISSEAGELTHNGVVEVVAKPGSKVTFASVHDMAASVTELTYRRAHVENDARIEWIIGEMSYGNIMSDTATQLLGNGSSSDATIINVGTGSQKLNITTRAVHFGKNTPSQMITRAVMRDEATAIINGITKIEKGATKANGEQTERVLMLSPKARGDANPILLIDEDDVKAGHAASVGQVNPEYVYYLMSRGIPKEEAQKLIIYGFLAPVVEEIPLDKLKDQLQSLVERKLGQ